VPAAPPGFGRSTVSMMWITPFDACTSAVVTCAPFTYTLPAFSSMSSGIPFTVFGSAPFAFTMSPAITLPGTT
jgi:hypothetical protein